MASYVYGSYVKTSGGTKVRSRLGYALTTSNTTYKYTAYSGGDLVSGWSTHAKIKYTLVGTNYSTTSVTNTTQHDNGEEWNTFSKAYTYTRKTSAYTITIKATLTTNGNTSTISKTFSIPALPYYTITYNSNGGSSITATKAQHGVLTKISTVIPTKNGYKFTGWLYNGKTYSAGSSITITGAVTLTAQWVEANYYDLIGIDSGINLNLDKCKRIYFSKPDTSDKTKLYPSSSGQGLYVYYYQTADYDLYIWAEDSGIKTLIMKSFPFNDCTVLEEIYFGNSDYSELKSYDLSSLSSLYKIVIKEEIYPNFTFSSNYERSINYFTNNPSGIYYLASNEEYYLYDMNGPYFLYMENNSGNLYIERKEESGCINAPIFKHFPEATCIVYPSDDNGDDIENIDCNLVSGLFAYINNTFTNLRFDYFNFKNKETVDENTLLELYTDGTTDYFDNFNPIQLTSEVIVLADEKVKNNRDKFETYYSLLDNNSKKTHVGDFFTPLISGLKTWRDTGREEDEDGENEENIYLSCTLLIKDFYAGNKLNQLNLYKDEEESPCESFNFTADHDNPYDYASNKIKVGLEECVIHINLTTTEGCEQDDKIYVESIYITVDLLAGGRGISFGEEIDFDDLEGHEENGIFNCNMDADFKNGITVYEHSSAIGDYGDISMSDIKMTTASISTYTEGPSVTLNTGVWIIYGNWIFNTRSGSGTSNREIKITVNGVNNARQRVMNGGVNYGILSICTIIKLISPALIQVWGSCSEATNSTSYDGATLRYVRIV